MNFKIGKYLLLFILLTNLFYAKKTDSVLTPIVFKGNEILATSELEEMIGAKRPPLLMFWQDNIAQVDIKLRNRLNETLTLFYKNEGFYESNITNQLTPDGIEVTIRENRPIVIQKIMVKSDLDISEEMNLVEGERFRATEFTEMKQKIKDKLLSEGYCSPKLKTKAYLTLEDYAAVIKIDLQKRKLCHFGKITIETNSSTMDNDILLSRLQFEEGDVFDINKIQESYEALYALESFDQLTLDYSRNFYNKKPINIRYKEVGKNFHTRMGVGYATDLKLQAKLYAEYKNFKGNGKKLFFDGLYSELQKVAETRLFVPYIYSIGNYHLDFQNTLGYAEEQNIHHFDERVLYEKMYFSHSTSGWYNSLGMGLEQIDTLSSDSATRRDVLFYPFMRLVYDKRDSKIDPKNGIYFLHEMEYGLQYSAKNTSYLKYQEELRLIYTPKYDITLSAVGRIGSIKVYSNQLPESKKFFAGGAFSNRAYGYEQIGVTESTKEDSSLGGFTLANLSLEANFPLSKNFKNVRGAIFTDNTMISNNQGIWEFSNRVVTSVGIGFRYLTPMGPFKIDVGTNIHNTDEKAIHFQVGQSF